MLNVIILAAGIGSRLRPLTETVPKCCVTVGGVSLIRRIVGQLQEFGLEDIAIHIVAGHLSDLVRAEVSDLSTNVIVNVDFLNTNNMYSCKLALDSIDLTGPLIVINGDCIYDDNIVKNLLSNTDSRIMVDSSNYQEESMKVSFKGGRLTEISKALKEHHENIVSIDMYYFEKSAAFALHRIVNTFVKNQILDKWMEVAINELLLAGCEKVLPSDINGLPWVEIDNHEDLHAARAIWGQ